MPFVADFARYSPAMTARPATRYPGPSMATRARWLLRARPADYMLALSVASASLPVVGKHLEPLGGVTAMSVWGCRVLPEFVSNTTKSWLTPGIAEIRRRDRDKTQAVSEAALRGIVAANDLGIEWPAPDRMPPVWRALCHRRNLYRTSVRYGDHPTPTARRVASQRLACRTRTSADLRSRRRVGTRQPQPAGLRTDVAPG